MKMELSFLRISLALLLGTITLCGQTNPVKRISEYTTTTTVGTNDDFIINTWSGSNYTTKRINATALNTNIEQRLPSSSKAIQRNSTAEALYWNARHLANYNDGEQLVERWQNLSNWNSANVTVSNGALYCVGGTMNPAGANYAFPLKADENARILGSITLPATVGTALSYVWIGVDASGPGAAPPAGAGQSLAIGFDCGQYTSNQYTPVFWNKGGATIDTNHPNGGTFNVAVSIDTNYISLSLIFPNHTNEFTKRVTRASFGNISNVHVWQSDQRGIAGSQINYVGARKGTASFRPPARLENTNDFVTWTTDTAGNNIRVALPKSYDSRTPAPLIIYCHGAGWDENFPWTGQTSMTPMPERAFFQRLLNQGYIVASGAFGGDNWGNQASMMAVSNLLHYTRSRWAVSGVFMMGGSMGGLTALNYISQRQAEILGYVGLYPVTSLESMTNAYAASIRTAYGIAADWSDYATKTAGYDPTKSPQSFFGVPMRFYASAADGLVDTTLNAARFSTLTAGRSAENSVVACTGNHGDPDQYRIDDVLAFLARCNNNTQTNPPIEPGSITAENATIYGTNKAALFIGNGNGLTNIPSTSLYPAVITNGQNFAISATGLVSTVPYYGNAGNLTNITNLTAAQFTGAGAGINALVIGSNAPNGTPAIYNSNAFLVLKTPISGAQIVNSNNTANIATLSTNQAEFFTPFVKVRHMSGSTATPAIVTNQPAASAGTVARLTNSTDLAGQIIIVPQGAGMTAGASVATITFSTAYTNTPTVLLSANSSDATIMANAIYPVVSSNSFSVYFRAAVPGIGTSNVWNYIVIQ